MLSSTWSDLLSFTREVCAKTRVCEVDLNSEQFELRTLFDDLRIVPESNVFLNWYRFDDVDEIAFDDLADYFEDIWYPSSDDIDILDASYRWMLSVSHGGQASIARFDSNSA